jgi:hypothetical protein
MWIVKAFDVLEHCGFRFSLCLEMMSVQQLAFQARKEALGHCIVEAIADRSHRGTNAEHLAALTEGDRGVLAAVIGVMDHLVRTALGESAFDRAQHQLRSQVILHRPADNAPAEHIQHDRQVHESRPSGNVGDIRYPQSIRCCRLKVPLHQIFGRLRVRIAPRSRDESAPTHPTQPGRAHQTRDPFACDPRAVVSQLCVHTRCTVRTMRVAMDGFDLCGGSAVSLMSPRARSDKPRRRQAYSPLLETLSNRHIVATGQSA